MDEMQFIGYLITAIITLGGFVAVIQKFTQPINELRIVMQEVKDWIRTFDEDRVEQKKTLMEHGKAIDKLTLDVSELKTNMKHYHDE